MWNELNRWGDKFQGVGQAIATFRPEESERRELTSIFI